ncbi:hypothetical protein ACJ41O_012870 [Fusarium nematophilum]
MSRQHGSSSHDTLPSCALERLPHLVHRELLSHLAYPDIKALVSASPIFLEHHTLDRSSVLRRSLPLTLGHAYVDAVAAFESSLADFQHSRSNGVIRQFTVFYKALIQNDRAPNASTNGDAAAMTQFHMGTIIPLVDAYANWANVLGQIEWHIDKNNPKFATKQLHTPESVFDMGDKCTGSSRDNLARGLQLLGSLFTKDRSHEELVAFMQEKITNAKGDFLDFITCIETPRRLRREVYPSDRNTKQENRDPLPFKGGVDQDADGPLRPLAWTLIWGGTYSTLYGPYTSEDIRRWGYVFWDADRLWQLRQIKLW